MATWWLDSSTLGLHKVLCFTQEANAIFPQEVTVTDVDPGQYTVLVMLDAEPYDPETRVRKTE